MDRGKINFIKKAQAKHGFKFDYSKVEYVNNKTKVCIVCSEHGEFWQTPHNHLTGSICPKCARINGKKKRSKNIKQVIKEFNEKHNYKFDYSKVEYVNNNTKICIICPEHGEFWQTPYSHLINDGCPKCSKKYMDGEYFKEKAEIIHNSKYDYSKVEYEGVHTKVCIICPEHGEFWQTPHHHLDGFGCKKCSNNFLDKDLFIHKSNIIHNNKYDYSKVEYVNNKTKVCIICPEHGEFWQVPNSHLNGRGCPLCKDSHLEREVKNFLEQLNIKFIYQYRNKELLGRQSLDFYIPDYNIGIECQGEQHFINNFYRSKGIKESEEKLIYFKELDERKREICKANNIKLIYYLSKKHNKYLPNNCIYVNEINALNNFLKN